MRFPTDPSGLVMTVMNADTWSLVTKVADNEHVPCVIACEILIMWGLERYLGRSFPQGFDPFGDYKRETEERQKGG